MYDTTKVDKKPPKKQPPPSHKLKKEPTDDESRGFVEEYSILKLMKSRKNLPWVHKAKP